MTSILRIMMASLFPVYKEIAEYLQQDPERAYTLSQEQLKSIIELSLGAPHVLLDGASLDRIKSIYLERRDTTAHPRFTIKPIKIKAKVKTSAPAPATVAAPAPVVAPTRSKIKIKIKPMSKASKPETSKAMSQHVAQLNKNHHKAQDMPQELLEEIIKWSEQAYDEGVSEDLLDDKVFDYVKRIYNQRRLGTNDKRATMVSVSSATGVGVKPRRERDAKLPFVLRSLDNMFLGEGDVESWSQSSVSYVVSAKMDGTSGLYSQGRLYTRGDAVKGRDISHVIPHVIPHLGVLSSDLAIRGEIVIKKDIFDSKYKDQKSLHGSVRKVNRNSVSGALGSINHIDPGFLSDLTFVAYEIISTEKEQMSPSEQFLKLKELGFETAFNTQMDTIDDTSLSLLYHHLLDEYEYEIDGLVVHIDKPYLRETLKNPSYAMAFKEALECDTAVTKITDIEWNPSQHGYLVPTVIYEPVKICGVTLSRATAHNAKNVIGMGLGPGAKVEVIYWGKVNPRIHKVLEAVEPYLPSIPYTWINDVNIKSLDPDEETQRTVQVKRIYESLAKIGAKGIGEATVGKIYDKGYVSVGDFVNLVAADIAFLGPVISKNIVKSIQEALRSITIPTLMASSKVFGQGLGVKKFTKVLSMHADFLNTRHTREEYVSLFKSVNSFAQKTAELAADGMEDFWDYVEQEIPSDIYDMIVDNTMASLEKGSSKSLHPEIDGKNICLTGFRDKKISDFITVNGGTVQAGCNTHTYILVRSNDSYTNKKTDIARDKGITIMTQEEFKDKFLS